MIGGIALMICTQITQMCRENIGFQIAVLIEASLVKLLVLLLANPPRDIFAHTIYTDMICTDFLELEVLQIIFSQDCSPCYLLQTS